MRIMVTGASGFVGSHLLRHLSKTAPDELVGLSGPSGRRSTMPVDPFIRWDTVDLTDYEAVRRTLIAARPDRIYHLAGLAVTARPYSFEEYYEANVRSTYNLAKAILDVSPASRLLLISSGTVYGKSAAGVSLDESALVRPRNEYGASKACAENVVWSFCNKGLDARIARSFNHIGPEQSRGYLCPDIAFRVHEMLRKGIEPESFRQFVVHRSSAVRDFTDVRDAVLAYVGIMESFECGDVVNVCSGVGHTVRQVAELLVKDVAKMEQVDIVADELPGTLPVDTLVGDRTLLTSKTGWQPRYSLHESLNDLWDQICNDY